MSRDFGREFDLEVDEILDYLRDNGKLIAEYDALTSPPSAALIPAGVELIIVPGAFYREYPRHEARGERLKASAEKLGITATILDTPSFCSPAAGAECLTRHLRQISPSRAPIVVSLSKGALDTVRFLQDPRNSALLDRIRAWITLSGIVVGTPLINYIDQRLLLKMAVRLSLWRRGYRYRDLLELRQVSSTDDISTLSSRMPFPILHVQGFPYYKDLSSSLARKGALRLKSHGASDGGGIILRGTKDYPGGIIAIKRADHYLSNARLEGLIISSLTRAVSQIM